MRREIAFSAAGWFLACLLGGAKLHAQVVGDSVLARADSIIGMDAIVVTVSRIPQRLSEIPVNVTVLSRREIERAPAHTVDDLLRQVPGFHPLFQMSSTVSALTTQTVSLRGLGGIASSRSLVLLDGVPLNDPFIGWVPWSMISLEELERVEIVRGGGAGSWGNLALGGAIHLITRELDESALSVGLSGGGQSTFDLQVKASRTGKTVDGSLRSRVFHTDGYSIVSPDKRGAIDRNPVSEHVTVGGRLKFRSSGTASAFLRGIIYSEERDAETRLSGGDADVALLHGGAELPAPGEGRWQLGGFTWYQSYETATSSTAPDRNSETPATNQFDVPAIAVGGSAMWTGPVGTTHRLSSGFDIQWLEAEHNQDSAFSEGSFQRRQKIEGGRTLVGAFLNEIWEPSQGLNVALAGRLDFWENDAATLGVRNLATGEVSEEHFPSRSETTVNGSAGIRYQMTPLVAGRGSIYRSFRAPTISELYRSFRVSGNIVTEANEELDPERLWGLEGGVDLAATSLVFSRITGFWNRLDDPIINVTIEEAGETGRSISPCGFVPAGGVCRQRRNVDSAVTRGVEVEIQLQPHPAWRYSASYIYDQTEIVGASEQPEIEGKWIRQAPRHQYGLGADFASRMGLDVSVRGRYVGERFDDDLNTLRIEDFFVVDLRVGYRLSRGRLYLTAENIFDVDAEISRSTDGLVRFATPRLLLAGIEIGF